MRTSIWLVRHGQTTLNKQRRYQGIADSPLTSFGMQQAEALARRLRRIPFTVAFVSPTGRTRATATVVLRGRTTTVIEDARWSETNHGRWEGLTYAEVRARFPDEAVARFADPLRGRAQGGESLAEVSERILEAWHSLLRDHRGGRILVVTHATPIQLILCHVTGLSPTDHWRWRVDPGSLTALDVYNSDAIIMRVVNETPRLTQQGSGEEHD